MSQIFNEWICKKAKKKVIPNKSKRVKYRCPICKKERYDVNKHLMAIHKLDASQARGLRSQLDLYKKRVILPAEQRKTKRTRIYKRLACPVENCHKVICYLIFWICLWKFCYQLIVKVVWKAIKKFVQVIHPILVSFKIGTAKLLNFLLVQMRQIAII